MSQENFRSRLVIPALAGLYRTLEAWSYPLIRFVTGTILVPHGVPKLVTWFGGAGIDGAIQSMHRQGLEPAFLFAYLVGAVETFGGFFVAVGFLTRPAAVAVALEMFYITFFILWPNGYGWTSRGYEYALMWGVLMLAIAFKGGGKYSIDNLIGKEF